jgi:hypothetical protein
MLRGAVTARTVLLVLGGVCVAMPATASADTAEAPSIAICTAGRESRILVIEHNREPAEGAQVPVGQPLTFSSSEGLEAVPLRFTIAAAPDLMPALEGGQVAPDAAGRIAFTSSLAATVPRTIYWNISFSISPGGGCPVENVTLATRSLSVAATEPVSLPWATPVPPAGKAALCHVPRLHGSSLRHARVLLERNGCRLGKVTRRRARRGTAVVMGQSPRAGSTRAAGTTVRVTVASPTRRAP